MFLHRPAIFKLNINLQVKSQNDAFYNGGPWLLSLRSVASGTTSPTLSQQSKICISLTVPDYN